MAERRQQEKTEILAGGDPRRQPRLGRYRLERRIGVGGMAEVFLARAEGPGGFEKQVVVKRIRPQLVANKKFVDMFLREARLLARLEHPNIVRIIELDEQHGEYFLALEYLEGLSLREVAERHWSVGRTLPIESLMQIIADASAGLDYAHTVKDADGKPANLVHRDVSPDNLFVTTAGTVKVIDFGIARSASDSLTQAGELKGKIPFMSPEVLQGVPVDARSDLFSMGISMYWLLTGRRPFDGVSDVHTMKAILEDNPRGIRGWNPKCPQLIEDIVKLLLEKDRNKRMKSAHALRDALLTLLMSLPRQPPPASLLVDAAQTLPAIEHEVIPPGPAALPVLPWPDGQQANAATRQRALPLDDDSNGRRKSSKSTKSPGSKPARPVLPPRDEQTAPQTEVLPHKPDLSTDEHERAAGSDESSTDAAGSSAMAQAILKRAGRVDLDDHGPTSPGGLAAVNSAVDAASEAAKAAAEAAARARAAASAIGVPFSPPSDPLIDVERIPLQALDELPTRQLRPPESEPGDGPTLLPRPGSFPGPPPLESSVPAASTLEVSPVTGEGLVPSRALPVAAGIGSAVIVVSIVLWITGAFATLQHVVLGFAEGEDAGVLFDSGAITEPSFSDGGQIVAYTIDAGTVVDAGEVMPDGETAFSADAGPDDLDEYLEDGKPKPTGSRRRAVQVVAPQSVQWQGPSGEVYGAGRGTLRIPDAMKAIYAVDLRRGAKTRVSVERGVRVVDYAKLPREELSIRVRPYADVYLGKEKLGTTPLAPIQVVVGSYEVRFVYKKVTKTVPIEVKAGKPAALNVVMTK